MASARVVAPIRRRVHDSRGWTALQTHFKRIERVHLRDMFSVDPNRGERMTEEAAGIFLDYSKNPSTTRPFVC